MLFFNYYQFAETDAFQHNKIKRTTLLFFKTQGFVEAGEQTLPNGRRVSLMCKSLIPYAFVRENYLSKPDAVLPAWAWQDRLNMRPKLKLIA